MYSVSISDDRDKAKDCRIDKDVRMSVGKRGVIAQMLSFFVFITYALLDEFMCFTLDM
jgi:hypothetical protein